MPRYFLEIAYFGKNYNGWQIQPEGPTVQLLLQEKLSTIYNTPIKTIGCGRTDSGVHASQFFLHFETENSIPEKFINRINKMLPSDVAVKRIFQVADEIHARFSATYRAYEYHCHFDKDPFTPEQSYYYPWKNLNVLAMQEAFNSMKQFKDFKAFCKTGGDQNHYLCDIFETDLHFDEAAQRLKFRIAANRFLRGMVRRVVGTLLTVGNGKISPNTFKETLAANRMFELNISVPPEGLFLVEVRYDTA